MARLVTEDTGQELSTVAAFLEYARFSPEDSYESLLSAVGLDDIEDVLGADDACLQNAGMKKEMHRKRFIKFAKRCRLQQAGVAVATGTGTGPAAATATGHGPSHGDSSQAEMAALKAQVEQLTAQLNAQQQQQQATPGGPPAPPSPTTPEHAVRQPEDIPHLFVSHSRRDPGALNAARLFAYALKHAVDRVYGEPFSKACYTGAHGSHQTPPRVKLWFDKEAMAIEGGQNWPEILAVKQQEALATISFLSNAYLGSNECIKELQYADSPDCKTLIPFFLEHFAKEEREFHTRRSRDGWRCDPDLTDFRQWDKKRKYVRKTVTPLQGVPAFFEDLAEFTCDQCRGKNDNVCEQCTSWTTVMAGNYSARAEQAALILGKYIDHLHFEDKPPERKTSARHFEATQTLNSRSVSWEVDQMTPLRDDVLSQTATSPTPHSAGREYEGALSSIRLDLDSNDFPMHPSLAYYLQDMLDEKGTFRDPSGEDFETVEQCVPMKMMPIALWKEGSQKTRESLDGSEELLVLRRRGYGGSAGYGSARKTGSDGTNADVEPEELLERKASGRGRATIVLGPAASGKTTMMDRLFVEHAQKAMACKNSQEIVAPYSIRVAELAKWLNSKDISGDLDLSVLPKFMAYQHGGAGTPLVTELTKLLERNQLTLLFDGLDEAGKDQLQPISRFIGSTLRSTFDCAIVVTSRESLFVGTEFKRNFDLVQIQPLTKELQRQIVERRFASAEQDSKARFFEESKELPEEMLENPLLLTMLIGVFKKTGELSRKRSELYEQGIRQLIRGRHADDQVEEIFKFLRDLGHLVHVKLKKRDFTEHDVNEHLGERSKLLALYSRATSEGADPDRLVEALQSDDPEDAVIALMVESIKGDEEVKKKCLELENMSTVFDRAYETGLLMCVDENDSDNNRTFRFTHLTFQEALAAENCLGQLQAQLESVEGMFEAMFGAAPDPWMREVLLMTAEEMDERLFDQLATFFLDPKKDDGTGANAVHISCMLKARGEDLEQPSVLGRKVLDKLKKLRSTEFMATTLQLPSEQLRRLVLSEIEAYTMPKAEISERLLQILDDSGTSSPWYVQAGIVRSLGSLRMPLESVGTCLVEIGFSRRHPVVIIEAVKALGNLELENSEAVVSKVLAALDRDNLRETAWKTLIAPLAISDPRVKAKLNELADQGKLSEEMAKAIKAHAPPVVISTGNENIISSSTNKIQMHVPHPEPEPEPEALLESVPEPEPAAHDGPPFKEPEPEPEPETETETETDQERQMAAYDPLFKVRRSTNRLLQGRSPLGGTSSINGGMDLISSLIPIVSCMRKAQELAHDSMVRDQFEKFMAGEKGWWVSSLTRPPQGDELIALDPNAAAKAVWFFHELSVRLVTGDMHIDEPTGTAETKTFHVRDGSRYAVGEAATFRGADGNFTGRVLEMLGAATAKHPARAKVTASVETSKEQARAVTVSEQVQLLAQQFLDDLESDYRDNSFQTVRLLFGDSEAVGVEMSTLDEFVQPQLKRLIGSASSKQAFAFCSVLHYLRYHSARLSRCDPSGKANNAFRASLEGELTKVPKEMSVFLRKELRVGRSELDDRPYWIQGKKGTQIEVVTRASSAPAPAPSPAPAPAVASESPADSSGRGSGPQSSGQHAASGGPSDAEKQEAAARFRDVMPEADVSEALGLLEQHGWNVELAIEGYLAMSTAMFSEGVPPSPGDDWQSAEPTPAEKVQSFTACSANEATQALEQTGGDMDRAIDLVLSGFKPGGSSGQEGTMSTFTVRFEHPAGGRRTGRGSASVNSNARTLEEFNSEGNMRDLKRKFAREFRCRPEEVTLEVEDYDLNPHARGIAGGQNRPGLVEYEVEHRVRQYGAWGPWGGAAVASNCRTLEEFRGARNLRQLRRQFASETGNDIEDVEVRVIGYADGSTDLSSAPEQPGRRRFQEEERVGETEDERARRLGLIDYAVEHRERRSGVWGAWCPAEVASNAPSLEEFQGPGHMRQLSRQYAAEMGVDPSDCEVKVIGYADPEQAKARGLNHTRDPGYGAGAGAAAGAASAPAGGGGAGAGGATAGSGGTFMPGPSGFLSSDSTAPIPVNPSSGGSAPTTPAGPPTTTASSSSLSPAVAKVMEDADCTREDAEAALAEANGDVTAAIDSLFYD